MQRTTVIKPLVALMFIAMSAGLAAAQTQNEIAAKAVERTEVQSGLALHVGATDGKVESALARHGRYLVRGLALDDRSLRASREALAVDGRRYLASVGLWRDRGRLPVARESVNLLIADLDGLGDAAPPRDELLRVLVPGEHGAAWVKLDGKWQTLRKPMPEAYDGWTQFWHDAQGTDCSLDTAVAPPTGVKYLHSAYSTSMNGLRLDRGRSLLERRGPVDRTGPPRDTQELVMRDAFNGLPVWVGQRRDARLATTRWKYKPLILRDGKIATILTQKEGEMPVFVDAATGEQIGTIEGGLPVVMVQAARRHARKSADGGEMVLEGDTLYQVMGNELVAIDWATGKRKWRYAPDSVVSLRFPRVNGDDGEVYVVGARPGHDEPFGKGSRIPGMYGFERGQRLEVHAVDAGTGKPVWRTESHHGISSIGYAHRRLVFMAKLGNGGYPNFGAFDTTTGKVAYEYLPEDVENKKENQFWKSFKQTWYSGEQKTAVLRGRHAYSTGHGLQVFDIVTGKQLARTEFLNTRCETGRGTVNFICNAFSNFIDIRDVDQAGAKLRYTPRIQARSSCSAGYWPGYGLLHYLGTPCGCANFIRACVTLHPHEAWEPLADDRRLVKGPAFGQRPTEALPDKSDWPEYLGAAERNSTAASALGERPLRVVWKRKIADDRPEGSIATEPDWAGFATGRIEAPIVAGGLAIAVDREAHKVVALDAGTGDQRWSFIADARIVTPPTLREGYCVFGGRDGWVYCLRAADGALVWKYMVAPSHRSIVAFGQLESSWPIYGAVPVVGGTVVAAAGHTPLADGGISVVGLDLTTGAVKWQSSISHLPGWNPLLGEGDLVTEEQGKNWVQEHPAVGGGGNLVKVGTLLASGDTVMGDNFALDAQTGELRFGKSRRGEAPADTPVQLIVWDTFLHERWAQADMRSANTIGAAMVQPWGAQGRVEMRATFAFDRKHVLSTRYNNVGLIETKALDNPKARPKNLVRSDKPQPGVVWRTTLTDDRRFTGQTTATVLTPDEALVAYREIRTDNDLPLPPSAGAVLVLDRRTGKLIQKIELPSAPMRGGMAVARGRLYVAGESGTLTCFGSDLE